MTARTFEDSAGTVWEVFEVQRSSQKAQAVSAGLERGWLAFASETGKRRLAPYPPAWRTADSAELERLCGLARLARDTGMALMARSAGDAGAVGVAADETETQARMRVPRIRPPRTTAAGEVVPSSGELPIMTSATSADTVESTVRDFARQARARRLPAIEAMVQLKALLARVYTDSASVARDLRAVRRWFVEAYYFDRDTEQPGAPDQSR